MAIEFRCGSCTKLLRTPDESAGKKAKCPQCGTVVDVPATGLAPTEELGSSAFPSEFSAGDTSDPFAAMGPTGRVADSHNPYASPSLASSDFQTAKPSATGTLTHQRFSFDDILNTSWTITMDNLGPIAVFGLIVFGTKIALTGFNYGIGLVGGLPEIPAIAIGSQVLSSTINFVVQTWLTIASILFCLRVVRDRNSDLNIFSLAGPYFLRSLGLSIVLSGISLVIALVLCGVPALVAWITTRDQMVTLITAIIGGLVCIVPIVMVYFNYLLAMFFVVDRREGVFAAMGLSREYMRHNKLTACLTILVVGFLGGFFVMCTCYFGLIVYEPFVVVVTALMYLTATGQAYQRPMK